MQFQRFLLHCNKDGTFTLELGHDVWKFEELAEALKSAQGLSEDGEARLTVYDSHGEPTIETFV